MAAKPRNIEVFGKSKEFNIGQFLLIVSLLALLNNFGFNPIEIYYLKQQKGNSSKQVKRYGRVALRKSATIWEKIKEGLHYGK